VAVNAVIDPATGVLVIAIFVFALMANGVHGALRDLSDDVRSGVYSTAIMLGARPRADDGRRVVIPPRLVRYAVTLQLAFTFACIGRLLITQQPMREAALPIVAVLSVIAYALLVRALRAGEPSEFSGIGLLHLATMLAMLIAGFGLTSPPPLLGFIVLVYVAPALTHSGLYGGFAALLRKRTR